VTRPASSSDRSGGRSPRRSSPAPGRGDPPAAIRGTGAARRARPRRSLRARRLRSLLLRVGRRAPARARPGGRRLPPSARFRAVRSLRRKSLCSRPRSVVLTDNATCQFAGISAGATGIEPATSGVTGRVGCNYAWRRTPPNILICRCLSALRSPRSAWLSQACNRRLGHEWATGCCQSGQQIVVQRMPAHGYRACWSPIAALPLTSAGGTVTYRDAVTQPRRSRPFALATGRRILTWRRRIPEQSQHGSLPASSRSAPPRWSVRSRSRPTSALGSRSSTRCAPLCSRSVSPSSPERLRRNSRIPTTSRSSTPPGARRTATRRRSCTATTSRTEPRSS
jgi:hypothetical protein